MTQPAHSQSMDLEHRLVKYLNAGFGLKRILQPLPTLHINLEDLKGFAELRLHPQAPTPVSAGEDHIHIF